MNAHQAATAEAMRDRPWPTSHMGAPSPSSTSTLQTFHAFEPRRASTSEPLTARTQPEVLHSAADTSVVILSYFAESPLTFELRDEAARAPAPSNTLQHFEQRLKQWRGILSPVQFSTLQAHLTHFLGDEDELREDGIKPSLTSFDELLQFLAAHQWAKPPAAALDKHGNWSLAWAPKRRAKANLILTFLGDSRMKWYYYNAERHRYPESLSGLTVNDRIDDILRALQVVDWIAA